MKRRRLAQVVDPDEIGKTVRNRVEEFLRETPAVVRADFRQRMQVFATNLALWGSKTNLTAHPDDPEEVAFHVIDSVMPIFLARMKESYLSGVFDAGRNILDLGSGGGFPGLVLAAASRAHFMLVEVRRKRASFLQIASAEMGLENVTIESNRAEATTLERRFDLVTARAFGDPGDFFAMAAKALKPGGIAMLYANPSQRTVLQHRTIIEYEVQRRGAKVARILAIYRQPVE